MTIEDDVRKIAESATQKGVKSTKHISVKVVAVENWVRQKCEFGCRGYANHFTCPPYAPVPDETRKRLAAYKTAMLIEFGGLHQKEDQTPIHTIMFELEREAFLMGHYKAFAYSAGPCRACGSCPAESVETPTEFSKKDCKNQSKARPSMEACGIDVFKTVHNAGYELHVVQKKDEDCFTSFGLLLLD
jgi:predicted metal-binding protein